MLYSATNSFQAAPYTGDQPTLDTMHKDLLIAGRAAALSVIPDLDRRRRESGFRMSPLQVGLVAAELNAPIHCTRRQARCFALGACFGPDLEFEW